MKLINLQKNDRDVKFSTLILLEILCVIFFIIIVFLSCLFGRLIVYFKQALLFLIGKGIFFNL